MIEMEGIQPPTPMRLVREILNIPPRKFFKLILGEKVKLLDYDEFLLLLREGYSLYRWGDGETAIARGKSISYQSSSSQLARKLLLLVSSSHLSTIHGLSWAYFSPISDKKWRTKKLFKVMFSTRVFLIKNHKTHESSPYVETQVWYGRNQELLEDLIDIIDSRPTLLVANDRKFLEAVPEHANFLQCPNKNAFEVFDQLKESIDEWLKAQDTLQKPCILLCAGPTSKALVLEFRDVAQAIDIGHGLNFYLHGFGQYAWKTKEK